MFKAAIRVNKITSIAQLRGASLHAQRHDETGKARVREGAVPGEGLAWSKLDGNDRDYLAAFKVHKAETGAGERKGAPIALQAICVVSPDWVSQAGDLHDPANPRNRQLHDEAKAWAESWGGEGAVFASRLDLDEKGGAVVDLMVSPVRESRGKPVISTNKALGELKGATGERNEYAALQTSWADWCREKLDPEIVRGTRKEITQRQHVSPETYGAMLDKAREGLSEAPQTLKSALGATDLSESDAEALQDVLTLRREIARHKAEGRAYEPPQGPLTLDRLGGVKSGTNPWPFIEAIWEKANRVVEAAGRFGIGLRDTMNDRYEAGRDLFPALADRMHLAAAVAKCADFMGRIEVAVKIVLHPDGAKTQIDLDAWKLARGRAHFGEAPAEVARHERNLGLTAPAVRYVDDPMPGDRETDAEAEVDADDAPRDAPRGLRH
jgi:hypothetical protein